VVAALPGTIFYDRTVFAAADAHGLGEPGGAPRTMFGELPASGFFIRHVRNVEMSNLEIETVSTDARLLCGCRTSRKRISSACTLRQGAPVCLIGRPGSARSVPDGCRTSASMTSSHELSEF
jgi:hypothetical protein